jgi:hypothetical protein
MTFDKFVQGINLLRSYCNDDSPFCITAEHDEIYVFPVRQVTREDQKKLESLGWYDNEANDENSWMVFV